MVKLLIIGITLGTAALAAACVIDTDTALPYALEAVAVSIIGYMVALTAVICARLDRVNRPADEAFESGYEIGHDAGWRECRDTQRPKVVPLRRESV